MENTAEDSSGSAVDDAPAEPVAVLVAVGEEPMLRVFPVRGELVLGRTIDGFSLDDERVSREHAAVSFGAGGWTITDRDSHNGTFVDGARITGELRRRTDCVVRLGKSIFLLVRDGRGYAAISPVAGDRVIGPELERVYAQVRRAAADPSLVVHGESGSGKELVARLFHAAGPRAQGPFVAVNCATIPEGVAERLLFGAKKGAFSGAQDAIGYLQSAHGGTLFLDEIAELDLAVQPKLLRVIESHEVLPVGATTPALVDVGIVAATHRELRREVAAHRFREDLYYRLARATVYVPPLRERKLDLARLIDLELGDLKAHPRLVETCCARPWPGNIRELRGALRLAAASARSAGQHAVRASDLPRDAGLPLVASEERAAPSSALTREQVEAALAAANGVVSAAARALGLHRTQLYRMMEKLGIQRA